MSGDIIHAGHIDCIKKCSKYGKVVIGLLTDKAIKDYKGNTPIIPFEQRKKILENIVGVYKVIKQESISPEPYLRSRHASYIASGDGFEKEEKAIAEKYKVKLLNVGPKKYSSSKIKEKVFNELNRNPFKKHD